MKKSLLSFIVLVLCLPAMFLCGCKNNKPKLPAINTARYFEKNVSASVYGKVSKRNLDISTLTKSSANKANLDQFVQYELTGDGSWIYKMYIESIYFYVYTSSATENAIEITFNMTNLANESDLTKTETITKTCPVKPGKNKSTLCKFDIGMVVATATTTKISIDITQTTGIEMMFNDGFKWMIYDLTIYGESRSYSK